MIREKRQERRKKDAGKRPGRVWKNRGKLFGF